MFWHGDLDSCWCCQRFAVCVSVVADPTCLQLCPIPHSLYFCWQTWCATLQASTLAEASTACLALWPAPFQGPGAVRSIICWLSLRQHGCQHHDFVILDIFGVHTIPRSMWTSFLGHTNGVCFMSSENLMMRTGPLIMTCSSVCILG